jgi:hypothetical protein
MGHPDFRVNGKIFATLYPGGDNGMVKLSPAQQAELVGTHAGFTPASGAWGRQGCTTVVLESVDEETVGAAMTLAWQNTAARAGARGARAKTTRATSRTSRAPAAGPRRTRKTR